MNPISTETKTFIQEHRQDDVRAMSLQAGKYPQEDMAEAVGQNAGWQVAEKEIPFGAPTEGFSFSPHPSLEQCSS